MPEEVFLKNLKFSSTPQLGPEDRTQSVMVAPLE